MNHPKSAHFLQEFAAPSDIFTPEDFSPEHQMIADLTDNFVDDKVAPQLESLERQEWPTTVSLLKQCAEIGLLGIEVPKEYGGENLDKVSAMIVAEKFARVASFGVSYGGQAGLGTSPLVFFGSPELKRKYLPALCKAEMISAYALSEAGSGSDAFAAKTTATLSPDGKHWVLNGEKMWITNAAFANIFMTFAQVDGRHFSCFVVEKSFEGVSTGAEEKKMGLKGSSTRPLILDNALVPVENLVGDVGKAHHIAFGALNIGRAKLAAIAVGAGKAALREAVRHAKDRISFGRPIATRGAIQHKLAEMAIRNWVVEAMVYRTAGMIDHAASPSDKSDPALLLATTREYAVECSILKVFGSEALDFIVDEAVQIFGGYGYSSEYAVERYYRDARVNRIFEGTNEINRLLISGMLMKQGLEEQDDADEELSGLFQTEIGVLARAKDLFRFIANLAKEAFGESIKEQQELLMHLSDIAIEIYAVDSALLRARKYPSEPHVLIAGTFVNDSIVRIAASAVNSLASFTEGNTLRAHLAQIHRWLEWMPINAIQARRRISACLLDGAIRT